MRPRLDKISNITTGMPSRYWGPYLDEITPMNDEQAKCIEKLKQVFNGDWWSLVILGTVGNGKTTLTCGMLTSWAYQHPYTGLYITQEGLVDACRGTFSNEGVSEGSVIEKFSNCKLLVIDELTVRGFTDYAKSLIQKILSYRHGNRLRTVLIGNLDTATFKGMFDEHILSRLREGETQIMKAEDMRVHGEF